MRAPSDGDKKAANAEHFSPVGTGQRVRSPQFRPNSRAEETIVIVQHFAIDEISPLRHAANVFKFSVLPRDWKLRPTMLWNIWLLAAG
jgi:hypothetical protein